MLVIISDLHLTDGTTSQTISADAFTRFRGWLQELAYHGSYRQEAGAYKPVERIDLVLLGDILDVIRSTRWSAEQPDDPAYARPWNDLHDSQERARLVAKVGEITAAILANNAAALKEFRRLAVEKPLTLPPATAHGFPARNQKRVPVETHIHYMAGNHDWFWHIPGDDFDQLRAQISLAMGLANPPGPFPHDPQESAEISRVFRAHRVFARHGDIYDPFNYDPRGRDFASLGDAIVIDLINGFPHEVRRRMSGDLPPAFLDGLDDIGNVKPRLLSPIWIQSLLRRFNIPKATAVQVRQVWNDITEEALESPFVRQHDTLSPFDTVDLLQTTLHFTRLLSFHSITELVTWIQNKLWGGDSSFAKYALEEESFKQRSANYFVYGHTHHYEVVPLDVVELGGRPFEQWYFNSGTWHPLYELAKNGGQNFNRHKVMTYLAFYKDDERHGRHYETWSGTLYD